MGKLIRVDFAARRRIGRTVELPDSYAGDVVKAAKKLRQAIKRADLRPVTKVSVRTHRSPTVLRPHLVTVTVLAFGQQAFSDAWLDWAINPETKHKARPDSMTPWTPALASIMRLLQSIINLHPGDYKVRLVVCEHLYAAELADRQQRARLLTGVTS